ncbi:MAG TPA: LytTR family DNA-binding domain-containing protein [Gemmatimonadales bacterium]
MPDLRVLIVDDEPLARERIRELLARETGIQVVAEARNGAEAAVMAAEHEPDVVFLDVQMPEVDGFGFLELLGPERTPVTVFVTAFDQYALRAFEVHALDYLLKPFDRERFQRALQRARDVLGGRETRAMSHRIAAMLAELTPERRYAERLVVKTADKTILVRTDEVDWIEAAANYLRLHRGRDVHLLRETMSSIESRLDPSRFVRIHRSTIVNLDRVAHLESWFHGDYCVKLADGTALTLSRTYRDRFEERLGRPL